MLLGFKYFQIKMFIFIEAIRKKTIAAIITIVLFYET